MNRLRKLAAAGVLVSLLGALLVACGPAATPAPAVVFWMKDGGSELSPYHDFASTLPVGDYGRHA